MKDALKKYCMAACLLVGSGCLQAMDSVMGSAMVAIAYKDGKYIPEDDHVVAKEKIHDIVVSGLYQTNFRRLMNKAKHEDPKDRSVWLTKVTLQNGRRELVAHMKWRNSFKRAFGKVAMVAIDFYHHEIITSKQFLDILGSRPLRKVS